LFSKSAVHKAMRNDIAADNKPTAKFK